jgi:hypothetical protein
MSSSTESSGRRLKTKKVFVRMTPQAFQEVKKNAELFHDGNITDWMTKRSLEPMLDVTLKMQDHADAKVI